MGEDEFEVGDVVELKSDDEQMVISKLGNSECECIWLNDRQMLQRELIPIECLEHSHEND